MRFGDFDSDEHDVKGHLAECLERLRATDPSDVRKRAEILRDIEYWRTRFTYDTNPGIRLD